MPAKKAIKKATKKKVVKKNLRNKLMKKNKQSSNEENTEMNPSLLALNPSLMSSGPLASAPRGALTTSPNQAANVSQLHGPNSLRAQLLAKAAFGPTLGYMPQQYGSISTEKRVEQLRTDNSTITSQIASSNATIESLKSENAKIKAELDEKKKMKKEAQKQLDKTQNEVDKLDDEVNEAERVEMKNQRLKEKSQIKQKRLSEAKRENDIVKYKTEIDTYDAKIHEAEMENETLKSKYEENKAYQRMNQLKADYQNIINENASLKQVMADPSFANPNDKIVELQQNIMKEQYQKQLYDEQIKKQMELNDIKIKMQSIPKEDLEAVTNQHAETMKQLNKDILAKQEEYLPYQKAVDDYEHLLKKETELNHQLLDEKNKHTFLQDQASNLESKNKGELGVNIKKTLTTLAKQRVINDSNERRIERANKVARMKEDDYQNQLIINDLEQDLTQEQQQQIQNIVAAQSNQEAQARQIELLKQQKDMKSDQIRNDAVIDELKKELSPEEQELIKSNATTEIKIDENKKYMNSLHMFRNAQAEESKARAQKEYYNSQEFNQSFQERAIKEVEAARLQKQREEYDLLMQSQKKLNEMTIADKITKETMSSQLGIVQQVDYIVKNELKPRADAINEKTKIMNEIIALKTTHPIQWNAYVEKNNSIPHILSCYMDVAIDELKLILTGFQAVVGHPNTE